VLPRANDSIDYKIKVTIGIVALVTTVAGFTLWAVGLPSNVEQGLVELRGIVQAQATQNLQVFETKADADKREERFLDAQREIKEELKGIREDLKEPRYIPAS